MNNEDALVANTADERQVKRAGRKETDARRQDKADVKFVLSSEPGRRVMNRILEHCGVWRSTFALQPAAAGFLSGQQDIGHAVMAWIEDADEQALGRMLQEGRNRRRRLRDENIASRIDSSTNKE